MQGPLFNQQLSFQGFCLNWKEDESCLTLYVDSSLSLGLDVLYQPLNSYIVLDPDENLNCGFIGEYYLIYSHFGLIDLLIEPNTPGSHYSDQKASAFSCQVFLVFFLIALSFCHTHSAVVYLLPNFFLRVLWGTGTCDCSGHSPP